MLMNNTTADHDVTMQVALPFSCSTFSNTMLGGCHSGAICSHRSLWMWGHNDHGHLGDGTTTNRRIPMELGLPSGCGAFSNIAFGFVHCGAICSDGFSWMWGHIFNARLGDGTIATATFPCKWHCHPVVVCFPTSR